MRTHGNGARVKSTVFVSTRAAVIGRATVDGLERWSPKPLGYRSEAASVGGLFRFNMLEQRSQRCCRISIGFWSRDNQFKLLLPSKPLSDLPFVSVPIRR